MSFKHHKLKLSESALTALSLLLSAAAGALLSGSGIAGTASFAGISAAGAVSLPCSAAVFTGALVRSAVCGTVGRNAVMLTSMLLIFIVRMFMDSPDSTQRSGIVTGSSAAVSGIAVSALIGELPYKLPFYLFYGAVSGFAAYAGAVCVQSLRRQRLLRLTGTYGACFAAVYTLAIASLCSLRTGILDPGIIAGTAVTLLGAYYYFRQGGAFCGALTVCGAFLASPESGIGTALLPVTGLLTGCIRRRRTGLSAAFFLLSSVVLTILSGLPEGREGNGLTELVSMTAGTLIFLAAAPRWSDKWIAAGDGGEAELRPELERSRACFLADSIGGIMGEPEDCEPDGGGGAFFPEEVCGSCWRYPVCRSSGETAEGFAALAGVPVLTADCFPPELDRCVRRESILCAAGEYRSRRASERLKELSAAGCRAVLAGQMRFTEDLLRTPSCGSMRYSLPVSRTIAEKLKRHGIETAGVFAGYNAVNRLIAEIYLPCEGAPDSSARICDLVTDGLGVYMECGARAVSGRQVRFSLGEVPQYTAEICVASRCAGESAVCGDTTASFGDGRGRYYAVLSDGMGTGESAAARSGEAVRLFRELVEGGADTAPAIGLVNTLLLAGNREESFATLDIACIDLDSGGIRMIKAGAAATLLCHSGSVMKITSPAFPVGIYQETEPFCADYGFEEGDTAVMFSDGVSENEYLFIKELLLNTGGQAQPLSRMVEEICRKAEVFNPSARSDDVTVMGIRLSRSRRV